MTTFIRSRNSQENLTQFQIKIGKVYAIVMSARYLTQLLKDREAAWPSGQRVGLAIQRSRVRVPLWPLASLRSRRLEVVGERENGCFFLCPLLPSACYAG